MALNKQPISLNFSQGLDTKTDPYQLQIGRFLAMQNSVFTTTGRLTKRNGFANLTTLPNANQTNLTTLNDNLIATGSNLYAYSEETNQWINTGIVQPVQFSQQSLVKTGTTQTGPDAAVSSKGLVCLVYEDTSVAYYQVSDSLTGQQIIPRQSLGANSYVPRVFLLGASYIVTYLINVGGNVHLRYIAIPTELPTAPLAYVDIATGVLSTTGYDAVVANNNMYIGWAPSAGNLNIAVLTSALLLAAPTVVAGHTANLMSVTADTSGSTAVIWMSVWDSTSHNGYTMSFNQNLIPILAPTQFVTGQTLETITSIVQNTTLNVFYEVYNTYGAGPNASTQTDYVSKNTITYTGTVGTASVMLRSVGLASKAFIGLTGTIYMLVAYGQYYQPTYYLVDSLGNIYSNLAYSNGGGYETSQVLPNVSLYNEEYVIPYLFKDFLTNVNKGVNNVGIVTTQIYTQTGVNLGFFGINNSIQQSSEIAGILSLTGGQLWQYDGVKPVEAGFNVWPEDIGATSTTTGGNLSAQKYYYQFTYEWTDNQGNLNRSAPSVPLLVDLTGSGTNTNEVTIYVPTLRLTAKVGDNPVRIVGYRWSTAQQIYYQFTSVVTPYINNPAVDSITITDTLADASITGNAIIYTTGGVLEDIVPPGAVDSTLFNNRLWLIDSEDQNLLWFSKQVIEATPIEFSDLLTIYVAPTSGAQGSTGYMTAIAPMDDKLIIFKKDAIYYINGIGPDNTGANSGYSDPVFVTAAVGCDNPKSIALMPNGLMFQSDKGIWLLGRDLSTTYIGAPVEAYNGMEVVGAQAIPATNQVRFVLASNTTLMYDYYFNQWGTFNNIYAISSTLYQGYQTYLNSYGTVFQETPGTYLDGSQPVLMSLTTGWLNLAGLQGYERFYEMFLLGTYYTPFKLNVSLAYDYSPSNIQQTTVLPDNYTPDWGGEAVWGSGGPWGGVGNVFQTRVFPQKQKCESFQVSIQEIYDPTYGPNSGAGLSLSGLNLVVGAKRGWRAQKASTSFG